MMEAFQALDKDKTGKIDAQQLRQILATLGDVLSSDEIDNLFKEVSIGSEGLDYQSFVNTLVHSYSLKDRPPPYVPPARVCVHVCASGVVRSPNTPLFCF